MSDTWCVITDILIIAFLIAGVIVGGFQGHYGHGAYLMSNAIYLQLLLLGKL